MLPAKIFMDIFHHFFSNRKLDAMYLSVLFRSFADAMSGIFVPIYLYSLGYSLTSIFFYYLVFFSSLSLSFIVSSFAVHRLGTLVPMLAGTVISAVFYLLLRSGHSLLLLVPLVGGMGEGIYYSGFNLELMSVTRRGYGGRELSLMAIVARIPSIFTLLGSLVIAGMSFGTSFIFSSLMLSVSSFFLVFVGGRGSGVDIGRFARMARDGGIEWNMAIVSSFSSLIIAASHFWPLYMYIYTGNILFVGAVRTFASLLSTSFLPVAGIVVDRYGMGASSVSLAIYALAVASAILFPYPAVVAVADILIRLSSKIIGLEQAKVSFEHRKSVELLILRESWLLSGRLAMLVPSLILSSLRPVFAIPLILSALALFSKHHWFGKGNEKRGNKR